MDWTATAPTAPGWYWLVAWLESGKPMRDGGAPQVVEVVERRSGELEMYTAGSDVDERLPPHKYYPVALWCGPLLPPPVPPHG